MMSHKVESEKFDFLRKTALKLGAVDAKIIAVEKIVVEDRVVLKCKLGCKNYSKTLACPPYAPSPEEFRKIVCEYKYALFMKFKSVAEGDADLVKSLAKTETDPSISAETKKKLEMFWSAWKDDKKRMLESVIDLEKAAMTKGYLLAIGFVSGECQLCEKCNVGKGICLHPSEKRYSEEAVGVNVKATANNAGISFVFPFKKNPETFALLLID